ncbi:hypothetical protein ACGFIV_00030 [Sphaerisporangium sp. NPDC049003]|uniref:hypothetical protein n=1 Tax=Sphaerisporangium sp. NPDC049003 TaxID=3364517 RepID=UPI003720283E
MTDHEPTVLQRVAELVAQQLTVLGQTYPAWQIRRIMWPDGTPGGWWATRYAALTPAQRAAGLIPSIARRDAIGLMMELAVQDEIAHQNRYAVGDSGPASQPSASTDSAS